MQSTAGEGSSENEEYVFEHWRKGDPCYIMAESLVKLCPALMWKAEFRSDRLGNLDEEIPKQC